MKNKILRAVLIVSLVMPMGMLSGQGLPTILSTSELEHLVATIVSDFSKNTSTNDASWVGRNAYERNSRTIKIFDAQDQLLLEVQVRNPRDLKHKELQQLLGLSDYLTSYGGTKYFRLDFIEEQ